MPALQPARGTQDLLPDTARRHRRVSETAREAAALYGFAEIATPIFEFTEVFARPIGEHTDIVAEGDVHLHRPRRRRGDAAAGKHRRGRARRAVERADPIDAAQILLQRADVPLRAAAEGPLPPVSPDRRRTARASQRRRPISRSSRSATRILRRARDRRPGRARTEHARRPREPRRLSRRAGPLLLRRGFRNYRRTAGGGSTATRCASSIRKTREISVSRPRRRISRII